MKCEYCNTEDNITPVEIYPTSHIIEKFALVCPNHLYAHDIVYESIDEWKAARMKAKLGE